MSLLQRMCHKTQLCKFHMAGVCTRGNSCTFAHGAKDMRQAPDLRNTKICPKLLDGECDDHDCPFVHKASDLKPLPWEGTSLLARVESDQIQHSLMILDSTHNQFQHQQRDLKKAEARNPLSRLQKNSTPNQLKMSEGMPAQQDRPVVSDAENLSSQTLVPARVRMPDVNLNQFSSMLPLPFREKDRSVMNDAGNFRSQTQFPTPVRVPNVNLNQSSPMVSVPCPEKARGMLPSQLQLQQPQPEQLQQPLYLELPMQEPQNGIMDSIGSVLSASENMDIFKPVRTPVPEGIFKPVDRMLNPAYVLDHRHSLRQSTSKGNESDPSMRSPVRGNRDARPGEVKPTHRNKFHKTRFCWFFEQGSCIKGGQCKFAHGDEELQPTPDLHFTKLCPMMLSNGECSVAACTFAHSHEELRGSAKDRARCATFEEPRQQPTDTSTETPSVRSEEEDNASESGINSTDSYDGLDSGLEDKGSWARQCSEDPSLAFQPAEEELTEAAGVPHLRRALMSPLIMPFPLDSMATESELKRQQRLQLPRNSGFAASLMPPPGLTPEPPSPQGWPSAPVNPLGLPALGSGIGARPLRVTGFGLPGTTA